jgi:hypothetical protein
MYTVTDEINSYGVFSTFGANKRSIVTVCKNKNIKKNVPLKAEQITLPLIPIYKFKTKEKFLNKMRTYITFS